MADLQIAWKKITRGLPKERRYAADRAPTIEEIKKSWSTQIEGLRLLYLSWLHQGFVLAHGII